MKEKRKEESDDVCLAERILLKCFRPCSTFPADAGPPRHLLRVSQHVDLCILHADDLRISAFPFMTQTQARAPCTYIYTHTPPASLDGRAGRYPTSSNSASSQHLPCARIRAVYRHALRRRRGLKTSGSTGWSETENLPPLPEYRDLSETGARSDTEQHGGAGLDVKR